eukprot:TRINITY_DN28691_c0_g1_i1.p1 TRINITY_DN28691_c0_g1~~TRINITY_DN28691_c0_g1_i1.p1  ORF type:complete len:227 (+),score=51.90 TRINITY_DN28691_c0_g1_i1:72-752(+)
MQLAVLICLCLVSLTAGGQRRPWPHRDLIEQPPALPIGELGKRFHHVQPSQAEAAAVPPPSQALAAPAAAAMRLKDSNTTLKADPKQDAPKGRAAPVLPLFVCVEQKVAALFGFGSQVAPDDASAKNGTKVIKQGANELPRGDPCVGGMTKLFWASMLTMFSFLLLCTAVPVMLEITRRRAPGQPLVLFGVECYGCCESKLGHQQAAAAAMLQQNRAMAAAMKGTR